MAVTRSGLFTATYKAILDSTQLAINLSLTTNKCAMFTNGITPDFNAAIANAGYGVGQYASNEVTGAGYASGGSLIASPAITAGAGLVIYDADDITWAASTINNARCALVYADALAGNNAIVLVDFQGDYSTINGQFRIQWDGTYGIFYLNCTP
jgi:hypothetical protein